MGKVIDSVDVICEHKSDGSVVPMRFRLMNEDGDLDAYTVKGYREIRNKTAYTTQDGIYVCGMDMVFECRIILDDTYRTVRLYFNKEKLRWKAAV